MPDKGSRPSKKPDGRLGPPPRYPKDQEKYADPENWKYPVHTPAHARAARRYFSRERNRAKYTENERRFIDNRIDQALRSFGFSYNVKDEKVEFEEGSILEDVLRNGNLESMSRDELLTLLLGKARMNRAKSIPDSKLSVSEDGDLIEARVKQYSVRIDLKGERISHDCIDWERRSEVGLLCKHIGKVLLSIPAEQSMRLLKGIARNRDSWTFDTS